MVFTLLATVKTDKKNKKQAILSKYQSENGLERM